MRFLYWIDHPLLWGPFSVSTRPAARVRSPAPSGGPSISSAQPPSVRQRLRGQDAGIDQPADPPRVSTPRQDSHGGKPKECLPAAIPGWEREPELVDNVILHFEPIVRAPPHRLSNRPHHSSSRPHSRGRLSARGRHEKSGPPTRIGRYTALLAISTGDRGGGEQNDFHCESERGFEINAQDGSRGSSLERFRSGHHSHSRGGCVGMGDSAHSHPHRSNSGHLERCLV
jgi:hypothetical protein